MDSNFEYIDDYFKKIPNPEEIKEFERRITGSEDFAKDVAFYLSSKQMLIEQSSLDKKNRFRALLAENAGSMIPATPAKRVWLYRVASAAAVLVLAVTAWYLFFTHNASVTSMADTYINENFHTLSVKMGVTGDAIQNGLRLYNAGKYDSAAEQFETIVQRDTANDVAKKYLGIVYLRIGDYDKSLLYFRQLENYSLYSNPAVFYQALTLLKRNHAGDKPQARSLLQKVVNLNLEGRETAQRWLNNW